MTMQAPKEITRLLVAWGDGDESALAELTPLVYGELHRLAHHYMSAERGSHTLQTTALVNEAYVRLIDWKNVRWQNRAHFFGVAAHAMRQVLLDYARSHVAAKRGGQDGRKRDEEHSRAFIERHQDKLVFGSDCSCRNCSRSATETSLACFSTA